MSRRKPEFMHASSEVFSKKLPSDFLGLERTVVRNAGAVIKDPFAILVLRFIADRTYGWSKTAEFISASQFLNGIVTKAGEWVCTGLPLGKTKLYACLATLKEAGAIVVETIKGRTRYTIPMEFVMQLKMSKAERARQAPAAEQEDCDLGNDNEIVRAPTVVRIADSSPLKTPKAVRHADTKEGTSSFRTKTEEGMGEAVASLCADRASPDLGKQGGLAAAIASVKDRAAAIVERRAARAAEHNGRALAEGFAAAARETWPDMRALAAPTGKQIGRLRHLSQSWDHPELSLLGFLEWSAQNWRGVYASKLQWVPNIEFTDFPDLEMMLRYRKAFLDSYERRETQKVRAGLTRRDELLRQLMFKGFSRADAELEVEEILSKENAREDLEKRERDLNDRVRRIEAKEQSLDTRIALGRAAAVKPVAQTKRPLKPTFAYANGDAVAPLPAIPEWKDDTDA